MADATADARPDLSRYERDVLEAAEKNHIWISAFLCMRPTDDLCRRIGRTVLDMLNQDGNTHLSESGEMLGLSGQRELVVRINKS